MREVYGAYKAGSKFKKLLSKLGFQKLNIILISQVPFFACIIIFRSTKMLAQITYLRLCALMSLRPYVFALMSCALLSSPLCRVSNTRPGLPIFHSTISLSPQKIPFSKFLMTSLHVICGLPPPNQKSWLLLWLMNIL